MNQPAINSVNGTPAANLYLQKVYSNMAQNFELQMIDAYQQLTPNNIDSLIQLEMQRLRSNYQMEEDHFVMQMLHENPIIVERRTVPKRTEPPNTPTPAQLSEMQRQRAESCRKSRINNKIKKAKIKYRHKFINNKLAQSAQMLNCIKDVIAQAEEQLLCSGYTKATLQKLRNTFGMDRSKENFQLEAHSMLQLQMDDNTSTSS